MSASYFPIYINPTFLYLNDMTNTDVENGACKRTTVPFRLLGGPRSAFSGRKISSGKRRAVPRIFCGTLQ
jgi:hypothetical protein